MIDPDKIKKSQVKKLLTLLEQWTRYEVVSRLAPIEKLEYGDAFAEMIKKENEIREMLYGTSNFVELGDAWNIIRPRKKKRKTKLYCSICGKVQYDTRSGYICKKGHNDVESLSKKEKRKKFPKKISKKREKSR